ncbi:MAG: sigma-70 family RNA polymerase sigma factor [Iphinoe sp. HA4291-MV1]|jgi:DNA-directed RNA polymerase specialized sigma24 family protein|nr:sigma-70 family RNA polymerase sigma factor [Iphinoe sp. HA4291-MV1]
MDEIDKQLLELVQVVQQNSPETTDRVETLDAKIRKRARDKALTLLIHTIQKSGKLFCQGKSDFPRQVYAEALQETWLYVCRKVHQYDPKEGKVITWVNFILDKRFKDAINKYLKEQQTRSLDAPLKNSYSADGSEMMLKEIIESPKYTFCEYEEVRQFIAEDTDGEFKRRHVKGHPQANFQEIALRRLDEQSWQAMSDELGITLVTLSSFYQRSIEHFALKFKEYFQK